MIITIIDKSILFIAQDWLDIDNLQQISIHKLDLTLSEATPNRINNCRDFLDQKLNNSECLFYVLNTGSGFVQNIAIDKTQIAKLKYNLLQSHAYGIGDGVPHEIVKWMLFLKIQSLSYRYSGVHLQTVQRLIDFYNYDITPVIYANGSPGASGYLSPLSHLALPLIGLGEVILIKKEPQKKS